MKMLKCFHLHIFAFSVISWAHISSLSRILFLLGKSLGLCYSDFWNKFHIPLFVSLNLQQVSIQLKTHHLQFHLITLKFSVGIYSRILHMVCTAALDVINPVCIWSSMQNKIVVTFTMIISGKCILQRLQWDGSWLQRDTDWWRRQSLVVTASFNIFCALRDLFAALNFLKKANRSICFESLY